MARRAKVAAPGFTLIELVMVILLIGIISITLLPRFSSPSAYSDRTYFDDLRQSLNFARDIALARGCRVQAVVFGADFYVMQDADCDSTVYLRSDYSQPVMRPDQSERLEYQLYNEAGHAVIGMANTILVFDPTGTVLQDTDGSLASFESITLTLAAGSLTVYGNTAYVQ